jgi:hypothetical protein
MYSRRSIEEARERAFRHPGHLSHIRDPDFLVQMDRDMREDIAQNLVGRHIARGRR